MTGQGIKLTLACVGVLAWLAVPATADDPFPPPWHGEWSTTFQYWEFLTPDTGQAPDDGLEPDGPGLLVEGQPGEPYESPGYLPSTRLWIYPDGEWIDVDPVSGRAGIWPLSGFIDVQVDNHLEPNPVKWVYLQLTWRAQDGGTNPFPLIENLNPAPVRPEDWPVMTNELDHGDGWFTSLYEWYLRPNPPDELFTISGDIDVDQLVLDTWCTIPEPSTLAMLLGGSLIALGWRRRR